jgi:hypothetical protein
VSLQISRTRLFLRVVEFVAPKILFLKTKKISPKIFELWYHLMILNLFLKLTSPKNKKIVSNKDLIKVPYLILAIPLLKYI